jgi:hypothetical protein
MTNPVFLSALDHFITSAVAGSHSRAHINRLQVPARAAFDRVNISVASIQSSPLLAAEIEQSNLFEPDKLCDRWERGHCRRTRVPRPFAGTSTPAMLIVMRRA